MKKNLEKVGVLWQRTSLEGRPYFTMDLYGDKYLVFPNKDKLEEGQPDFVIHREVELV